MPTPQWRTIVSKAIACTAYRRPSLALLALVLCTAGARADDSAMPMFRFNGFGTLGVVHSSEDKADFVASNILALNGAGHTHTWSADVDSLIGAQVSAAFTPRLSAILQVISRQNYANSYRPQVEWANVKYAFTPEFSVRAGRVLLPAFLVSDYRAVGYANPWVRPPIEVYTLVANSYNDGVEASYRVRSGEFINTVQGTYGTSELESPAGGGTIDGKDVWSVAYTGEYGAASVHLAYIEATVSLKALDPLFDGFRQFGAEGIALADKYDVDDKRVTFIGVGAKYDPGAWFVMGEWGTRDTRSVLGERTSWYVSGGYRLGDVTPYMTYADSRANSKDSDPGLSLTGLPPFLAAPARRLNDGLNAVLETIAVQKSVSVGARWDFAPSTALKLQFDHIRLGANSSGSLINLQPGFRPGGTVNVFSATLDFVF